MSTDSFGKRSAELKSYDSIAINISNRKLNFIKIPVKALDVSHLCRKNQGQKILLNTKEYPNLCQLELVNNNTSDDGIEVGILIGLGHYWEIVAGKNKT